jgi:hypothetical protein
MRQARIKVAAEAGEAVYHCLSRTVNGEQLFDDPAKEILRRQFWQVAEYCGVEILTYAILSNHFHVLVRVPQTRALSEGELLRRYQVLYPRPTRYQTARLEVIRRGLPANGPEAQMWRRRQLALMGDVSSFMKLVKQRFSIWYNRSHRRFGTLWSERFKSVLVEPQARVLRAVAAYIDLNAVRAGLVGDPKDYRFCGYAEAVAGAGRASSHGIPGCAGQRCRRTTARCSSAWGSGRGSTGRRSPRRRLRKCWHRVASCRWPRSSAAGCATSATERSWAAGPLWRRTWRPIAPAPGAGRAPRRAPCPRLPIGAI